VRCKRRSIPLRRVWRELRHPRRFVSLYVRSALLCTTKWFIDRARETGELDVMVISGSCAASFSVSGTEWNLGVPGDNLIICVAPENLGGNCTAWRHLHQSDHLVAELRERQDGDAALESLWRDRAARSVRA
jgi:hypothetical protein